MIKDVFKLKKNSWHTKLMKRIWGYETNDFTNMCPYFWLSIINVIIVPFFFFGIGFYKVILFCGKPFLWILDQIIKSIDKHDQECRDRNQLWIDEQLVIIKKEIAEGKLTDALRRMYENKDTSNKSNKKYENLYWNLHWRDREFIEEFWFKERKERRVQKSLEEVKKATVIKTSRQEIAQYTKYTKIIGKVIVVSLIAVLAYFLLWGLWTVLSLFFIWVTSLGWKGIINFIAFWSMTAGIVVLLGIILVELVKVLGKGFYWLACKYGTYCIPCEKRRNKIANFFSSIFTPIGKGFIWFFTGIITLWEIAVAMKQDNCPGIDWED